MLLRYLHWPTDCTALAAPNTERVLTSMLCMPQMLVAEQADNRFCN